LSAPVPAHFLHWDHLVRFVRQTLGCTCPDEVFDDVRVGCPSLLTEIAPAGSVEILVGRRLLVTVVPTAGLADPAGQGRQMLERGREVRDAQGLNRYRLVLVGPLDAGARAALEAQVLDERTHLHLLPEL